MFRTHDPQSESHRSLGKSRIAQVSWNHHPGHMTNPVFTSRSVRFTRTGFFRSPRLQAGHHWEN